MKVFLAGAERRQDILLVMKAKNVLCSYYYIRQGEILRQYKEAGMKVMIDSGAHTFFSERGIGHGVVVQKESKTQVDPEEYFEQYLDWLVEHKDMIDYFVELDIQEIVGMDLVKKWRARIRERGLDPIVVLHPKTVDSPDKEWDEMTSEYSYCGIEGSLPMNTYISKLQISERKKCRVHGFAMTKAYEMSKVKFYSVDSTSWLSGSRFGLSYFWRGNRLLQETDKNSRRRFKAQLIEAGLDWEKIETNDGTEVDKMNLLAWNQFNEWAEKECLCAHEKDVEGKGKKTFEGNKGNIQEICSQNPDVKKGNVNTWKHGRRSERVALRCDNCYAKEKCPRFEEGGICEIREDFKEIMEKAGTRNLEAVKEVLIHIYRMEVGRYYTNLHFEKLDGGVANKNVTVLAHSIFSHGKMLQELIEGKVGDIVLGDKITITQQNVNIAEILMKEDESGKPFGESLRDLFRKFAISPEQSKRLGFSPVGDRAPDDGKE